MSPNAAPTVVTVGSSSIDAAAFLATARFLGMFEPVLDHVIKRSSVGERARKSGLTVSADELQAQCDAHRRAMGLHSVTDSERWLASVGYTMDQLEAELEFILLRTKKRAALTREEIDAYFAEHRTSFDRARISSLTVKNEGLAREIVQQVQIEKKDFRQLALKHSVDEATKELGGYVGWVRRPALDPEVAPRVFAAAAGGQCLNPVKRSLASFQVILVHEIKSGTLDDATQEEIRDRLLDKWIADVRSQTSVALGPK